MLYFVSSSLWNIHILYPRPLYSTENTVHAMVISIYKHASLFLALALGAGDRSGTCEISLQTILANYPTQHDAVLGPSFWHSDFIIAVLCDEKALIHFWVIRRVILKIIASCHLYGCLAGNATDDADTQILCTGKEQQMISGFELKDVDVAEVPMLVLVLEKK